MHKYSDNYADSSGTLYQFKRDEQDMTDAGNPDSVTTDHSPSFKYKSSFFKTLTNDDNGVFKNLKIAVPLKYLSNSFRSLEMPPINLIIHLELNWSNNYVISDNDDETTFNTTNL